MVMDGMHDSTESWPLKNAAACLSSGPTSSSDAAAIVSARLPCVTCAVPR